MKLSVLGKICQTFPKLEQHKSKASRENEFHKKNIATGEKSQTIPPFVTSPIFDVHVHPCHPALPFSSIFTYLYPFSAIFIHFDPPSTIFIHCYPFSSMSFYWIQNIVIRAIGSQLSEKKIRLKNQFVFIILVIHIILSHSPVTFWRILFVAFPSLKRLKG